MSNIESSKNFIIAEGLSSEKDQEPKLLRDVQPIKMSRGSRIDTKEKLKELIELPLVPAAEILYEKNIQTTESTANYQDIQYGGHIGIVINYDTLSEENKHIAQEVCSVATHGDGYISATIEMAVNENTTVESIKNYTSEIAEKFITQPLTWAPSYTIQEMRQIYAIDPNDEEYQPEDFSDQFYYDPETKYFYTSKEICDKIKNYPKS